MRLHAVVPILCGDNADRSRPAWTQVYRSLEHGYAKAQCSKPTIREFPQTIQDFAEIFAAMQFRRHEADYDPLRRFEKSEVLIEIARAETAIDGLSRVTMKDKRAFAAFVLLRDRKS